MRQFDLRRNGTALAAIALVCAGWAGSAQAASATPTGTRTADVTGTKAVPALEDCGFGKGKVRPPTLILACADANDLGEHLVWTKWTSTGAYATGKDTWNTCVPNCAASKKWDKTSATFTLSKPVHTKMGWLFEQLVVHLTGKVPAHMDRTTTYSEAPVSTR